MHVQEAIDLLKDAPRDNQKSKVNPNLTRLQVVEIIEAAIKEGGMIDGCCNFGKLLEKRVWQVVKNQRNPKY